MSPPSWPSLPLPIPSHPFRLSQTSSLSSPSHTVSSALWWSTFLMRKLRLWEVKWPVQGHSVAKWQNLCLPLERRHLTSIQSLRLGCSNTREEPGNTQLVRLQLSSPARFLLPPLRERGPDPFQASLQTSSCPPCLIHSPYRFHQGWPSENTSLIISFSSLTCFHGSLLPLHKV